ncbi:hypothetical protein [Pasteuria penetrans]|uniref:hypothetical protein n=1 Tax=Pasteuria penetrans TaxID=86005 RepID=UPI0011F02C1E|nr:hypothetical protein [Pasteuria penetrans]
MFSGECVQQAYISDESCNGPPKAGWIGGKPPITQRQPMGKHSDGERFRKRKTRKTAYLHPGGMR